jgi:hypothetical protein
MLVILIHLNDSSHGDAHLLYILVATLAYRGPLRDFLDFVTERFGDPTITHKICTSDRSFFGGLSLLEQGLLRKTEFR